MRVNGTMFYGPLGRALSALSYVSMLILCMQIGGLLQFMPPKPAALLLAIAATFTAFNERLQGGASKQLVRIAAQLSDNKNELELINRPRKRSKRSLLRRWIS
jgi:hypothetical protein